MQPSKSVHSSTRLYAKAIGVDPARRSQSHPGEIPRRPDRPLPKPNAPKLSTLPDYWKPYHGGELIEADVKLTTGVSADRVLELSRLSNSYPAGFHIHPKVQKLYEQRIEMAEGKRLFDYGAAELLAYASLLNAGTPVRLAGQDSQRGTFNQRHSVLVDTETETRFIPLDHMTPRPGPLRGPQLAALRGRGPRLRVRLRPRLP